MYVVTEKCLVVTEKCLVAFLQVNYVAYFEQKKEAVRFKNNLQKEMNTDKLYKAFKFKVVKE